jgi:hypothetical protein
VADAEIDMHLVREACMMAIVCKVLQDTAAQTLPALGGVSIEDSPYGRLVAALVTGAPSATGPADGSDSSSGSAVVTKPGPQQAPAWLRSSRSGARFVVRNVSFHLGFPWADAPPPQLQVSHDKTFITFR